MKEFSTYQYIGGQMTDRDKLEVGSKYWNEGKWDTFVRPLLPENNEEMVLIDMGCNAGLHCKIAEDMGFNVIGLDGNAMAINRAIDFRNETGHKYGLRYKDIDNLIDLPVADYYVYINSHYYIPIEKWEGHINKLKEKAANVIIVTTKKKPNKKFAPSDIKTIAEDMHNGGFIYYDGMAVDLEPDETKHARYLMSRCFNNPSLKRIKIDELDNGNAQQRGFLKQIDNGIDMTKTDYYRRLSCYRNKTGSGQTMWTDDKLYNYIAQRVVLYGKIKQFGQLEPITVRLKDKRIIDGNHRHAIMKHLGYKTILCKVV